MMYHGIRRRSIQMSAVVVAALVLGNTAHAQQQEPVWGSLHVQNQANSDERVAYFSKNLRPHGAQAYSSAYRSKIVRLNWYDNGVRRSGVVNLNRSFDIYGLFQGASLDLTEQAKAILDELGRAITSEGIDTRMYAIAGHSISQGEKREDHALSQRRAEVVFNYLTTKFDIPPARLTPVGFGSHNLKDKDSPQAPENNRVEICLIEDLYDEEPKTTVQLPDRYSSGPQEIKVTTAEETSASDAKSTRAEERETAATQTRTTVETAAYQPEPVVTQPVPKAKAKRAKQQKRKWARTYAKPRRSYRKARRAYRQPHLGYGKQRLTRGLAAHWQRSDGRAFDPNYCPPAANLGYGN